MKNARLKKILIPSLLVFCLLNLLFIQANAEGNGGAVSTKGEITLVEEDPSPSTSSSEKPKTSNSATPTPVKKPIGKLPSTGELVKTSLSISGIVLLVIGLFLFVWKRSKTKGKEK